MRRSRGSFAGSAHGPERLSGASCHWDLHTRILFSQHCPFENCQSRYSFYDRAGPEAALKAFVSTLFPHPEGVCIDPGGDWSVGDLVHVGPH